MIQTRQIAGLAAAGLVAAFAGCSKPPAPTLRVIEESQIKIKIRGGEEIAAAQAAPAAEAPKAESK